MSAGALLDHQARLRHAFTLDAMLAPALGAWKITPAPCNTLFDPTVAARTNEPGRVFSCCNAADMNFVDDEWVSDFSGVEAAFKTAIQNDPRDGIIDLVEFVSAMGSKILGDMGWNAIDFLITPLNATPRPGRI